MDNSDSLKDAIAALESVAAKGKDGSMGHDIGDIYANRLLAHAGIVGGKAIMELRVAASDNLKSAKIQAWVMGGLTLVIAMATIIQAAGAWRTPAINVTQPEAGTRVESK